MSSTKALGVAASRQDNRSDRAIAADTPISVDATIASDIAIASDVFVASDEQIAPDTPFVAMRAQSLCLQWKTLEAKGG